jgi:hypothetical protein
MLGVFACAWTGLGRGGGEAKPVLLQVSKVGPVTFLYFTHSLHFSSRCPCSRSRGSGLCIRFAMLPGSV